MVSSAASKMWTAAVDLFVSSSSSSTTTTFYTSAMAASLTPRRRLTCSASNVAPRLVPYPPDLIGWVRREGGFVHRAIKVRDDVTHGLGLVASEGIPTGSELIALPDRLPLRWSPQDLDAGDGPGSVLANLARQIPDLPRFNLQTAKSKENCRINNFYLNTILYPARLNFKQGVNYTCGEHVAEELWGMRLGLKLLQERARAGSFWWPYISNLPETFSVPIFFSGEDIKNLQYAPIVHQVNKRCRFLLDFEREIENMLTDVALEDHPFGGQEITASSLGWAMSAVSSRAFRLHGNVLPDGSQADIPMMLPLIDMCNHSFHPNARIVQEQDAGNSMMLVVAETQIEQDTPILLNYGSLNNDLFLLDYGFVVPSNPHDFIELKYDGALLDAASMAAGVSSPNFSSPAQWQLQILSRLNLHGTGALPKAFVNSGVLAPVRVTLGGQNLIDGRLLAALRVLLSNDVDGVQKHNLNTLMSLSSEAPLGVATEVTAFRTMIALCVIALEQFPSKTMEDESLLKEDISSSAKLAIQFRMQKKLMIIDAMKEITKRIKELSKEKAASQG
ncbi:hypothetical protein QJS04_geneDACA018804 [Acorus gramineus]|uniref:SET domain-containing protein n=1 Tax=Acorus gramineus TaxID=55184 RepID=A0AAV9BRA6_ACOGR|nr:hypothetical protein QJS04_geneDACA018804 [Acorus gramineus]